MNLLIANTYCTIAIVRRMIAIVRRSKPPKIRGFRQIHLNPYAAAIYIIHISFAVLCLHY